MFKVTPVAALKDNYVWLIQQDAEKRVAIVDPGDAAPVLTTLKETGLDPEAILITHHHWDHVNGIQERPRAVSCGLSWMGIDNGPMGDTAGGK